MDHIYPGQMVRIKTMNEFCEEFGFTEEYIAAEPILDGYRISYEMQNWLGRTCKVCECDPYDHSIYLDGYWWPMRAVKLVSEPGEFFGFKVGDVVEFRQFEDMVADGSYKKSAFAEGMKHLCGKRCTITGLMPLNQYRASVEVSGLNEFDSAYCLDTLMFEHVEDVPEIEEDDWSVILVS